MTRNLNPRRATLGALAVVILLGAAAQPAQAKDTTAALATAHAPAYVSGGVGKEDEARMRRIAKDWPLRMMFSERKDNEWVAGVDLAVTDHRGARVLALHDTGPMTYAKLPAGKYRVSASLHGVTESREVTLDGKHGRDLAFHWKGSPKVDPWDGKPIGGKQVPG